MSNRLSVCPIHRRLFWTAVFRTRKICVVSPFLPMASLLIGFCFLWRQQLIQNLPKDTVRLESAECRHGCLAAFLRIPDCHNERGCAAGAGLYRFLEALADLGSIPIAVQALLKFGHIQVQGPGVCSQFGYA